jgi:predicted enzyme related to lactoylglutathione lyase
VEIDVQAVTPPPNRFFRYELRTTDRDAAQKFYTDLLGSDFWDSNLFHSQLPERARALGAPPHWLGHIRRSDAEETASRIVAHGGTQLGPARQNDDGSFNAVIRDPFGANLVITSLTGTNVSEDSGDSPVAWHQHHGHDQIRTFTLYAELFGWVATEALEMGPLLGTHQMFAWDESGPTVGSMANTALQTHVHTQWLFFFPVVDIELSLVRVRELGGVTLEPVQIASGDVLAACDDSLGAAFGLFQFAML